MTYTRKTHQRSSRRSAGTNAAGRLKGYSVLYKKDAYESAMSTRAGSYRDQYGGQHYSLGTRHDNAVDKPTFAQSQRDFKRSPASKASSYTTSSTQLNRDSRSSSGTSMGRKSSGFSASARRNR